MTESNPNTAENILTRLLNESKQEGRKLVAEKTFAAETVGVRGPRRQFQQIVKTISEGDENVATGYKKQMIVSVKSIEAANLPVNVFRDGVKQIISDIMKVVNADVLLPPEAKSDIQDVANQLMRYADSRGKVGARAAATAAGLAKRVRSSLADSLSGKRSLLLRGLGYLLKAPDRKEARAKLIADARLDATQGALDNRAQGKYDPELMRSAASRIRGGADPASPEGKVPIDNREQGDYDPELMRSGAGSASPEVKVLVDIRTGINKLVASSVGAEKSRENEYQSDREDASLKDEEGQEGQDLSKSFSPSKKDDTKSKLIGGTQSLIGKLMNLIPGMSTAMKMLPMLSGITTMVTEALGTFFASAIFATLFAGILATAVVGAAWFALLSKWADLFGLKKKYKAEGNRNLAVSEIAQLKSEGTDMSFADTAATTGEMARAVANTRLSQGSITEDELSRLKKRGVEPPKSGEGFTDENAIAYLEVRKEIANEKLTGKTGALGGMQAGMIVALGGTSQFKPSASSRSQSQNTLPLIDTQETPSMRSGFVEGGTIGDEGALETLPEGRPTSQTGDTSPTRATSNDSDTLTGVISAKPGELIARTAKGETVRRTGFRNARNNNPGNIRDYGDFAKSLPASIAPIGTDGEFAVFATKEAGRQAQARLIFENKNYKNLTIPQMIHKYAPKKDHNDEGKYRRVAFAATGADENTKMKDLSPSQRVALQNAMEKYEGGGKVAQMAYAGSVPTIRSGNGLGQASTALDQQKTATNNIALNMIRNAASPPAPTQSTYVPYRVNPRDDSRQSISSINAI